MKIETQSNPRFPRRPRAPALVLVALAAMLFAALPSAASAKAPPKPLYWGAQIGSQLTGEAAPWDMNAVYKFEHMVDKRMSIVSFSSPFAECSSEGHCNFINFPFTPLEDVRNHDSVPFFSWSSSATPEESDQSPYRLEHIINGSLDPYLRKFAESARIWSHPFFIRFNWEMNGFWFPWSEGLNGNKPGEFVAAWRHIHDIFTAVGAENVSWVWCPNVDFTRKLIPLKKVYPGDEYVDWTCMDGFNWGKRQDSAGWQSFNEVFSETYQRIRKIAPHKPMVLGEVASNENGGSKAAWIRNMLRIVPSRYRKIRALIWFDVIDRNTNWPVETSKASIKAFANGIRRRPFRPNLFGDISASPIPPLSW
ncbi:MAG TPA: glycosyl hydrolase [Solirubrobacterales bacterium]